MMIIILIITILITIEPEELVSRTFNYMYMNVLTQLFKEPMHILVCTGTCFHKYCFFATSELFC